MIEPALRDDTFLADVKSAPATPDGLDLWWLGQSGFLLHSNGNYVLLDPYLSDSLTNKYTATDKPHIRMSRRVVAPQALWFVDAITASHGHTDHLDPETLQPLRQVALECVTQETRVPRLIAPTAIKAIATERFGGGVFPLDAGEAWQHAAKDITIEAVPAAHHQLEFDDRGRCKYLGYVVRIGQFAVYHSGDSIRYEDMGARHAVQKVDVVILPINGKLGNMNGRDAANLAKDIGAKIVIPCHYDMFEFNTADPYEQFVPECERIGQGFRVLKLGERFTYPEKSS